MGELCWVVFGCFPYEAIPFLESSRIGRFGSLAGLGLLGLEEDLVWIFEIDSNMRDRTLRSQMRFYFIPSAKCLPFDIA